MTYSSLRRLPLIIAVTLVTALTASWAWADTDYDTEARKNKADYYFLAAQNAYLEGDFDKYCQMTRRAFDLDSTDADIAGEWAVVTLIDKSSGSNSVKRAYDYLKARFLNNPKNYYSGMMFASVAMQDDRYDDAIETWQLLDSLFPRRSEPTEQLARAYMHKYVDGDSTAFDKAMEIYNRMEEASGTNVHVVGLKLQAYGVASDTTSIFRELVTLDSVAPHDSYISLYIADIYSYLNNTELALKFYDKACELDSTNGKAYESRANFFHQQGDSVAYDREVFHALQSANLDVSNKIEMLRSYVSELYSDPSQEQRIRQLFNKLEELHPGEPTIHGLYGSYLYLRDDFKGAQEQYSYAIALDPSNQDTRSSYLQLSVMAGDTIKALESGIEAIEKFPENMYFPIFVGSLYIEQGDTIKAIAVLDSVNVSEVHNPKAVGRFLASKGDILASVGDTVRALTIYDEAIAVDPSNNMALNNAAYFMAITGGDLSKAENYSVRSLKGEELNPTYLDTYAWILFLKKDYSMAKLYIDMALNSYPESADTTAVEGEDIPEINDDEVLNPEEEVLIEEVDSSFLPSADIYDHAGDIYFMNGEKERAIELWKKAQALDPDNALINSKIENGTIFLP